MAFLAGKGHGITDIFGGGGAADGPGGASGDTAAATSTPGTPPPVPPRGPTTAGGAGGGVVAGSRGVPATGVASGGGSGGGAASWGDAISSLGAKLASDITKLTERSPCEGCGRTPVVSLLRTCRVCNARFCKSCAALTRIVPKESPVPLCSACLARLAGISDPAALPEPRVPRAGALTAREFADRFDFEEAKLVAQACSECYTRERDLAAALSTQLVQVIKKGTTFGFVSRVDRDTTIICFRGTCTFNDIITDMMTACVPLPGVKQDLNVHEGFLKAYLDVRLQLLQAAQAALADRPKRLLITGHSLGAALATLAAWDIATHILPQHDAAAASSSGGGSGGTESATTVKLISLGSPRVGDATFATAVEGLLDGVYRIVNNGDIVAMVPTYTALFPYQHAGTEVRFSDDTEHVVMPPKQPDRTIAGVLDSFRKHGVERHVRYLGFPFPDNPAQLSNE